MRLERLTDRIEYCFKYGEDCLKPEAWDFVCKMKRLVEIKGDLVYLTPKQHIFMGSCFKQVSLAHPPQNESSLDRMKRRLAELRARTKASARVKRQRDLITPNASTLSPGQFLNDFEEDQITARSSKANHHTHARVGINILRKQTRKHREG